MTPILRFISSPRKEWVDLQGGSAGALADERFFARAARVACIVGGACGMAMIFDSPLGGILGCPIVPLFTPPPPPHFFFFGGGGGGCWVPL